MDTKGKVNNTNPRLWIPYGIFAGVLLITIIAAFYVATTTRIRSQSRFQIATLRTQNTIQNRLEMYIAILRGTAGLFAASHQVSRDEFRAYVQRIDVQRYYPGIQGIGYSVRLKPTDKNALIARMKKEGFPEFTIHPDNHQLEYHSVIYLEPLDKYNRANLGYDLFTDPVSRDAMVRARDTGFPTLSGKVNQVGEIGVRNQPGFLIYVPIYQPGKIPDTIEQRRQKLIGFVFSPFHSDDFLQGIFGSERYYPVNFQVYDGMETSEESLLYVSSTVHHSTHLFSQSPFTMQAHISIGGHIWTLICTSRQEYDSGLENYAWLWVLCTGILISLTLFGITRSQIKARLLSENIASALAESESRYQTLFEHSPVPTWEEDFSDVKAYFDKLRTTGIQDFQTYFEHHPKEVQHCAELVKILDVNREGIEFFGFGGKEHIPTQLPPFYSEESLKLFTRELISLANGETRFENIVPVQTKRGDKKIVSLRLTVAPGYEKTLSKVLVSFFDLTVYKQTEEALREQDRIYREAISQADAVLYQRDYKTETLTFFGEGIKNLTGYSKEELTPEIWKGLIQEEIMRGVNAGLSEEETVRRVRSGEVSEWKADYRIRTKNGETRWMSDSSIQLLDSKGKPVASLGIIQDITDRKLAELEDAQFLEKLRILIEIRTTLTEAISEDELSSQAVVLGRERLGFDRVGIWLTTDNHEYLIGAFGTDEHGGLRDERGKRMIVQPGSALSATLDRETPWVLAENVPLYNHQGEVVGQGMSAQTVLWDGKKVIGWISIDNLLNRQPITKRQCELLSIYATVLGNLYSQLRSYRELHLSEERYRQSITQANAVPYKREGNRLVFIGEGISTLTGYSPEEFTTELWRSMILEYQVFGEDSNLSLDDSIKKIQSGEMKKWRADYKILTRDKEERWISDSAVSVTEPTRGIIETLGILQDITERKRLESQLLHSQKMEVVGTLAGGVAHDFNNLLTTILGNAEILLSEKNLTSEMKESLEDIYKAGERSAELTRQLLLFSRKTIPQLEVCDFHIILNELERMLKRTLGPSIEILIHKEAQVSSVMGDPTQIQQIIMNLAINARDAMPHGGKLTLKTENMTIDEDYCKSIFYAYPGQFLLLSVSDTGIGMDEETKKRIFEPFFTTKGIGKGTGLGLAVVYGIVKSHKGWIHVYSEPGHGAVFRVYFPLVYEATEEIHQVIKEEVIPGGRELLLLVDDEEMILKLGKDILQKNGYTVITANRAMEGLKIYRENQGKIALVITDLLMPEMDGRVLINELRKLNPEIKIVLSSGANISDQEGLLPVDGIDDFVVKPFQTKNLLRSIRKILDRKPDYFS